jgi:nucleotide-binding universal stress UspA family protein
MKVLLAIDGSLYSKMAIRTLEAFQLPSQTEVTVMTVVPEYTFLKGITLDKVWSSPSSRKRMQEKKAEHILRNPVQSFTNGGLKVESLVRWGNPAQEVLNVIHEKQVDLVVIGAKGTGNPAQFPLGSVAQKVMKHADCSVLLAREKTNMFRWILVAIDGSQDSDAAIKFLLELPLTQQSEIILLTCLQSYSSSFSKMSSLDLKSHTNVLIELQANEEREARKLINKNKKLFQDKGYKVTSLIPKGEPAEELLASANTLYPDLIALGAKGLTGIEDFMLGNVSQRVARFSRYSVLIGRSKRGKKRYSQEKP